jgi:hypothetical protein
MQYARWKEECKEMDSHVGSGKIITAPVITEDGFPIKDPLVLLEATSDTQGTSTTTTTNGSSGNGIDVDNNSMNRVLDKQIIGWKLTLHQIGKVDSSPPMICQWRSYVIACGCKCTHKNFKKKHC